MKRFRESDIAEMRAKGYDRVLLEQMSEAVERGRVADELIAKISEAFRGITLEDGIGLQEAQGLDDYEDEATCAAYRDNDEKEDWHAISSEELNRCYSSLSFFDPKGMRFHLPAYIIAELRGEYNFSLSYGLTRLDAHSRTYFSALSQVQRQVVREYLLLLRDDPEYQFDRSEIDKALRIFWTDSVTSGSTNAQQDAASKR